jgi:hypothetical protein
MKYDTKEKTDQYFEDQTNSIKRCFLGSVAVISIIIITIIFF